MVVMVNIHMHILMRIVVVSAIVMMITVVMGHDASGRCYERA
jgi:hypothetical protein